MKLDGARWDRIQLLFHQAADQPVSERLSFLHAATSDDPQLMAEVQSLLEGDSGTSLLDQAVARVASRLIGPGVEPQIPQYAFGPYRIRELLGEGGMGVVYLAEREDLGSLAAIKVLRDSWLSAARRERFEIEQRTLAQLTHPCIARLYDADTLADGTPWFAMEYVKGLPLTAYCREHRCSLEERLRLFRSVCEAVSYAHSRMVIHRDLKPPNIFVQLDGSVKLLDFGIAKQLDERQTPVNQTRTGLHMMTPAYAAPEQIRGEQAGTYTDVYALGVVLYELLTGRTPFDLSHQSAGEAEAIILQKTPEKPSLVVGRRKGRESVPRFSRASWADLDVLCLTAMHKDPERRYRSVDGVIRDIDHYVAGEPLQARADTLGYRVGKFLQRNRRAVAAVALVAAAIVSLVAIYTVRLTAARNEALAQSARTERVLRFTLNLFNGGDKESGPASDLRVTTLVDRGALEARSLSSDSEVHAEIDDTLGEVYQKLGNFGRADSLLQAALAQRRSFSSTDSPAVADSLLKLGLLRLDEAKLDEAEHLVRQGLAMDQRIFPPGAPPNAAAVQALGKVLEERGSYDQAIQVLGEAVRMRSGRPADKADLADSLMELANTHYYAGHYGESESLNKRLLTMHRELYGERHPLIAEDLINLAAIQQQFGNYKEAESLDRHALEITGAFYGEDHYKTASNLARIAEDLVPQDRYQEAKELLQRALAIRKRVLGAQHPRVALDLNGLGNIALMQDHFDEAKNDFQSAIDIWRTAYAGKHYWIGIALTNLGGVYLAEKQYEQAQTFFRQALAMYGQTLAPGSLDEAITHIKLGRALLRQNRFREAEAETLAGYRILSKQANPSVSWLKAARKDLAAIYVALQEPEKAREFVPKQSDLPGKPKEVAKVR